MTNNLWMFWWAFSRSILASVIPWGWVDIHPWASPSGHSPFLLSVSRAFLLTCFPGAVGPCQSWVHHWLWQKVHGWGDYSYGDSSHWWSRRGNPGNCNHLLPLWSGKSGALSHAFDLIPVGLTWATCGGGEDLHQLTLCPMGVSWLPLLGCNHSFSRCCNHSISPYLAMSTLVTPVLFHSSHPDVREGALPIPQGGSVGELRGGSLLVPSYTAVHSHCILSVP